MTYNQLKNIEINDFINRTEATVVGFPSVEFIANVKKDQIILSLIKIEDLKKRISKSPNNKVLVLALQLQEYRLKAQKQRYTKIIELLNISI